MKKEPTQAAILLWAVRTFGSETALDKKERSLRFLEEALEVVQSLDLPKEDCLRMVDYVYSRDKGGPCSEIGGALVTLRALAEFLELNSDECLRQEFNRINTPSVIERCRRKQAQKEKQGVGKAPQIEGLS